MTTINGYPIVAATKIDESFEVILVDRGEEHFQRWVISTHNFNTTYWNAGDYFGGTHADAVLAFQKRVQDELGRWA